MAEWAESGELYLRDGRRVASDQAAMFRGSKRNECSDREGGDGFVVGFVELCGAVPAPMSSGEEEVVVEG